MRSGRRAAKVIALVVYIIVILVATPQAQKPASFSGSPGVMSGGVAAAPANATSIDLLVGRSTILNVGAAIARVSLTVPDVADAMVTSPQQLLIHGKTPGTISLFVWDRAGGITTYEVNVRRDLSQLVEQMKQLFPGEQISVTGSGKDVVIAGTVSSKYVIDKAADVAGGYVEKKENVVNLLKQIEGQASNQVMLRVRFAEVSRSALQELGASLFTGPTGYKDIIARSTTQQFPAPDYSELSRTADINDKLTSASGKYSLSDFLNLFIFSNKYNVGTVIRALQEKGLFQSLAEPNLIASNGKEASFLAGGEYPYPIVQAGSGGNSISIVFKEFGVRLSFTPTVLGGDMINLKVKPEVSALDFTNAITLEGFRVPALSTRRTETEVELQNGQTFAIAGLLNNTVTDTMRKIPGIGDVPILGWLFKSKAMQKQQTELVVMITPQILRRGTTGVSEGLPNIVEPYLGAPSKSMPQPGPYTGSPTTPATRKPRTGGTTQEPDAPAAAMPAAPMPAASEPVPAAPAASMPAPAPMPVPAKPPVVKNAVAPTPEPKVDTKAEARQLEEARKAAQAQKTADKKAAQEKAVADRKAEQEKAEADRKAAEEKAEADKKAAIEKARQDKLDAERAKREAEVARKTAEADRKKQEELKKHEKALADAAARLRQAQAAYQAEIDKKKGIQ
ncbi:MAG TPA: pilus assembly protein N-terminal domain-containing protein [Vicinamibacterales bacterium]|jgi:pilus assembly protein CpaC|nr:pilus assembly protein N-terminal domain-containing protein [Vicinamibacterales bacterium]